MTSLIRSSYSALSLLLLAVLVLAGTAKAANAAPGVSRLEGPVQFYQDGRLYNLDAPDPEGNVTLSETSPGSFGDDGWSIDSRSLEVGYWRYKDGRCLTFLEQGTGDILATFALRPCIDDRSNQGFIPSGISGFFSTRGLPDTLSVQTVDGVSRLAIKKGTTTTLTNTDAMTNINNAKQTLLVTNPAPDAPGLFPRWSVVSGLGVPGSTILVTEQSPYAGVEDRVIGWGYVQPDTTWSFRLQIPIGMNSTTMLTFTEVRPDDTRNYARRSVHPDPNVPELPVPLIDPFVGTMSLLPLFFIAAATHRYRRNNPSTPHRSH